MLSNNLLNIVTWCRCYQDFLGRFSERLCVRCLVCWIFIWYKAERSVQIIIIKITNLRLKTKNKLTVNINFQIFKIRLRKRSNNTKSAQRSLAVYAGIQRFTSAHIQVARLRKTRVREQQKTRTEWTRIDDPVRTDCNRLRISGGMLSSPSPSGRALC